MHMVTTIINWRKIFIHFYHLFLFLKNRSNNNRNAIMLTSRYDLYIGIGIGSVSVIIIILIVTIIFCKCCVPSSSHRYFGRSVSHYAAINNIDAKTYFKPPQHLVSNFFFWLSICLSSHDVRSFRHWLDHHTQVNTHMQFEKD